MNKTGIIDFLSQPNDLTDYSRNFFERENIKVNFKLFLYLPVKR